MPFSSGAKITAVAIAGLLILETVTTVTSQSTGDYLCITQIEALR